MCKNQIDVLKISDVPFPTTYSSNSTKHHAAEASAPVDTEIPEFSVCYRMLIDYYNDELFSPFGANMDGIGPIWYVLDRMCWKCGRDSEGYQGGLLIITRNIRGDGLGTRIFKSKLPIYHSYNMARDIAISKWTHICYSYSSITQKLQMYQDGLKVFTFTFGDGNEDPLPSTAFEHMRMGENLRGLFSDVQVYNRYFKEDEIITWTTSCPGTEGEIFHWDKTRVNIVETTGKNVTFMKMDSSEVCPDPNKPVTMQQPRLTASGAARRRFQPERRRRTSYAGDIMELLTDPDQKTYGDAENRCFRLNGELLTLPQNEGRLPYTIRSTVEKKI